MEKEANRFIVHRPPFLPRISAAPLFDSVCIIPQKSPFVKNKMLDLKGFLNFLSVNSYQEAKNHAQQVGFTASRIPPPLWFYTYYTTKISICQE